MKLKNKYYKEWHRKFAFLPLNINGETIFFQYYWMKFVLANVDCDNCKHFNGHFKYSKTNPYEKLKAQKLKILFRKNLKMSTGKLVAQAVHAAIGCKVTDPLITVIILGVSDKKYEESVKKYKNAYRVVDAGYTEVEPGTETCLGYLSKD